MADGAGKHLKEEEKSVEGNNDERLEKFASGRPVKIIAYKEDHEFELDERALESILLQDHVKDRHVVVVSVAGAFRKGKSFLLDFFLRYMQAKGSADWLGSDDVPLEGFSWRGGCERDTTGILLWSEVFLADLPSGEKVGVILMDTQGAFDSESTVRDCATVFALSTMISSVQIYNLSHNIQEDDLQHLQLFTEYGRLALADIGEKPFQRLQFLVRDWSFPYEADYGAEGGKKILARRLAISDKQHPELQSLRRHINSCFTDISCFLMPHPGLKVATSPNFDGRLSCIESDFKRCLAVLVPMLLAPENLVVKQISGQKVKAKELLQYFKSYINMYKGNELPEPKSMLMATAEANNLAAVASAKEMYQQLMEEICGGTKPYLSTDHLESEHRRIKDKSLMNFGSKRKMGGDEFSEKYRIKLEEDLEESFQQFRSHNESKNIFKAAKTPAVFFALAVFFYVMSGVFGLFGIYEVSNVCNFVMGIALLTLITWAYIRYSGELVEFGSVLDDAALVIWDSEKIQWHNRNKASQCKSARKAFGLVRQQMKICRSTYDAMSHIAKAAEQTFQTCQLLFEKRRWNCSTVLTVPNFTPDLTTGTREQAFVYALSSASVVYTISKACAAGGLFNCSCSAHPKDPPNGNFKWGGCGDNIRWAIEFGKHFTDSVERKNEKKNSSKKKRGSMNTRVPEHSLDVIMGSMGGTHRTQSKSHLAIVNLQNNRAGRKAIEMSLKMQCKCHGVSGSCIIKICWKALPKFIEIGERLQKKYGTSVEVAPRKIGHGKKLVPIGPSQYYYNGDDLVYITKSPDYCLRDDKTGSLGTRGRPCNKTSNDYDSCEIMCCGRGYITLTVQKIEMCRCKFHWCCTVVCKKCMYWVDTHICN